MKIFFSVLAIFAILSSSSCSDVESFDKNNNDTEQLSSKMAYNQSLVEADASHQWEANEKLTKLLGSFGTSANRFNEQVPQYPAYYGGAYIAENGKLIIYVHGDLEKSRRAISAIIGESNVDFQQARFSYKYLTDLMDELNEFVIRKKDPSAMRNFEAFALMDKENKIVVDLKDFSEQQIAAFHKAVSESDAISFRKAEGEMVLEADLNPGCKAALNTSGTSYGSFGFKAKRNSDGKLGMVTAGHVINSGETLYYGATAIGVCSVRQISGSIDASFVPITSPATYVPSNTLCGTASDLLSTTTSLPGVGTVVNKRGATTGYSSGTIVSTNATWTSPTSGNTLTNITTANYTSDSGDSGGIVYTYISSSGTRPTVGIHTGAIGSTRYFTKASLVLSSLGLSRN